jgi:Fe-S-cluster formation regulator IscX/YfhJ
VPVIRKVIEQMESEDGWVALGAVGNQLANLASDFDPRTFGFRKLSDLVRKTGAFEIEHPEGGTLRIRTKQVRKSPKTAEPQTQGIGRQSPASDGPPAGTQKK